MNALRPERILKPNQRIALLALANGECPKLVAARADVSVATLYRWRRNPAFQEAHDAAIDNYHENFPEEEGAARLIAFQALLEHARWSQPANRTRAAAALLKYLDRPRTTRKSSRNST